MFFAFGRTENHFFMTKLLLLCGITITILSTGCRHKKTPPQIPPLPVTVAQARLDSVPNRMSFVGYLASNVDAVIQPRVNGYLMSTHYSNGLPVKRGQLLYTIDPGPLSTTQLSAEAALESARAQAIEARNNYERAVPLASINAISQAQLDQYTAQYKAAESAVRSAEQALRSASLNVGYTKIYSPVNGIIAISSAFPGDFVGPGTQFSVLTTVSNIDTLTVDLSLPMSQYLRYAGERSIYDNEGLVSDIRLTLADDSEYPLPGAYDYTRKNIARQAGTIELVVLFPNPQYTLKPGQFARVHANIGPASQRIVVPQQCVGQVQGVNSVWIVKSDSTAEYRRVILSETFGAMWCIDSGVNEGEWVVAEGQQKLHDGMKVSPEKR